MYVLGAMKVWNGYCHIHCLYIRRRLLFERSFEIFPSLEVRLKFNLSNIGYGGPKFLALLRVQFRRGLKWYMLSAPV